MHAFMHASINASAACMHARTNQTASTKESTLIVHIITAIAIECNIYCREPGNLDPCMLIITIL